MAVARTWAVAVVGIGGTAVEVEADLGAQLPRFSIIGLADRALAEAEDRVRQAAANAGVSLPARRLTVNLAPADLPKHGTGFDLAVALAALAAGGVVDAARIDRVVHIGELGLDGRVRSVPGVLPACIAARDAGFTTVVVPADNVDEARLAADDLQVLPVSTLREAVLGCADDDQRARLEAQPVPALGARWAPRRSGDASRPHPTSVVRSDFADVHDQDDAIRAAQIAAAGAHHLSMVGSPGTGKSMIAERLAGIMPRLDDHSARELSCIRSIAGEGALTALERTPPFVAPHHTASTVALLGGGSGRIRPGAVTLACHGVLFLDEVSEMSRHTLNALRQPIETGEVRIHRASGNVTFPARFQLTLASNPCPCGFAGTGERECTCSPDALRRYRSRLAGPIMDRIDVRVRVAAPRRTRPGSQATTARLAEAVDRARRRAVERAGKPNAALSRAELGTASLAIPPSARRHLDQAWDRGILSMRGYDRVRRVAWTIADLEDRDRPGADDVDQALYFRRGEA
ncbi:YifB family Mg chelatase-like AAA ATPase [Mycetocola reblochoni]|uniref:MG(2+) CHELATASE FAMILY PROTEIN / ComM-related protein n=2 Tax=Mycetocola reblochoni TaxID=331618 RepID=A0A1R4JCL1_9MICO|nr:YifB family Mg chelatase-like AAA ATPase [Mycetocola reblochoni]RLP69987.1 ATP-binding protein [Mycetocola reblochoni]SJN29535.1 MG(2+) CHELATASE FAMILY PROTEIN / ComM-related protein [Mycetocola reblochoni REB411]